jgi:hypothetical protein
VLSGWDWTAFLDTFINYSEFRAITAMLYDAGRRKFYAIDPAAMGDDLTTLEESWKDTFDIIGLYNLIGF